VSILIEAKNIYKYFKKDKQSIKVLTDINLKISAKDKVAIVGKSGAGKTTLLHILGTLEYPSKGQLFFKGEDITNYSEDNLALIRVKKIGFVFQFHYLINELTAFENVVIPAVIYNKESKKIIEERADFLFNKMGIFHRKTHKPSELSGGEQQRVAIARALINFPEILMADEPTGNLDTKTSENIFELLYNLHETLKMALLIVTHNIDIANKLDKKLEILDGKIIN
jgi:lipoprotein-releasing system ATP-binding protein